MNQSLLSFLILMIPFFVFSKTQDSVIVANKVNERIIIDGFLNEDVWKNGCCTDNFTQRDPNEGKPATQKTEVRIAYDELCMLAPECLILIRTP